MIEVGKIYTHPFSNQYWYVKHMGENAHFMTIRKDLSISNPHWEEEHDYTENIESHKYFIEVDPDEAMKIKAHIL